MNRNNVAVIPASKRSVQNGGQLRTMKDLRVAAYCRVSTGDESQQTSYTTQKRFYSDMIQKTDGWIFAGIYADEAISGTSRAKRVDFNRMIEDAKAGKLDYIVTKSISRFARNTIDTLNCVRELRMLNPPVGIMFEKENIDTLDSKGELILTILSALAQDESRSISDNIRWSIQKNFQEGKPMVDLSRMIGYDKGPDGEWVINEAQAKIVRTIFSLYLEGESAQKISRILNEQGHRTVRGKQWRADAVMRILRNEKYVGDLEMQKTVTESFLTHKCIANTGLAPRYYVENHHIGIIDRLTWDRTQTMLAGEAFADAPVEEEKKPRVKNGLVFSNLRCGERVNGKVCGERFVRLTYTGTAAGYQDERSAEAQGLNPKDYSETYAYAFPVWRCKGRMDKTGCEAELLQECGIEQSFMEMLYRIKRDYEANGDQSEIAQLFRQAYERVYENTRNSSYSIQRMEMLDLQIRELEENLKKTIRKQVEAMREEALYADQSLQQAVNNGVLTLRDVEIDIENGLAMGDITASQWGHEPQEGSQIQIYADLARDIRQRIADFKKEKGTLEADQGGLMVLKKNYDFFMRVLLELPEQNKAGMPIRVNGLDTDGSLLRTADGKARPGRKTSLNKNRLHITPERVAEAPDYLRFERGVYAAFIKEGLVEGDVIRYTTNFGVTLMAEGNRRTLGSFLGFRFCDDKGLLNIYENVWEVAGTVMQYRRKEKKKKANKE